VVLITNSGLNSGTLDSICQRHRSLCHGW